MRISQETYFRCMERCSFLPLQGFVTPRLQIHLLAFHLFFCTRDGTFTEQIVAQEIGEPEEWTVRVGRSRSLREGFHSDKLQKVVVAFGTVSSFLKSRTVHGLTRVLLGVGQDETGAIPKDEVQALSLA